MHKLSLFQRTFLTILSGLLSLFILLIFILFIISLTLPNVDTLRDAHLQVPMRIYSADNKLMAVFGSKKRSPVQLNQIPPLLVDAVIATEDSRFYQNSGVDFISILRATKAVLASGKKVQGASTITMQVARNFFLNDKKTYGRKIREMILAIKINHEFSKDKILTMYLNKIYLGASAYGVAAAAQVYYGKPLNQLTLAQMAMLAGLPQAPTAQNPLTHPKLAIERRNHVLERMLTLNYINQQQYQQAIAAPVTATYHAEKIALDAPYVTEMIRKQLYATYGNRIYEDGFVVRTSINSHMQTSAKLALDLGAIAYSKRHGFLKPQISLGLYQSQDQNTWSQYLAKLISLPSIQPAAVTQINPNSINVLLSNGQIVLIPWSGLQWAKPYRLNKTLPGATPTTAAQIVNPGDVVYVSQNTDGSWSLSQFPQVEGGIISINPTTGAILSLVGGTSYPYSHFNRITQAVRQPGSSFKPFIYSAALAKGMTLATRFNDAPIVMNSSGENKYWRPHNDTHLFYGMTTLREALVESRNIVSVKLLQAIGIKYALQYLTHFGFNANTLPHTLSLALGSGSITPLSLANGYTVFANSGHLIKPTLITSITDSNGKTIYQAPSINLSKHQAISPQVAYLMTSAMQGVIQKGTGHLATSLDRDDLAGKTGTTNNQVDAWFSGYNHQIETTVWMGFDNNQRSLHEYADTSALPIWINYMKSVLANTPEAPIPVPNGLTHIRINAHTGKQTSANDTNGFFEIFRLNHVPAKARANTNSVDNSVSTNAQQSAADNPIF